jgi:hypothetical protein
MKLRYKILAILSVLLGVYLWGRHGKSTVPQSHSPAVLPAGDTEQIIVDPGSDSLIIRHPGKPDQHLTLPDRPSVFDVKANGTVKVTSQQFGFEHHLFLSGLLADKAHFGLGVDGMYWKRLDLGAGVGYPWVGFAKLTYNIKGNLQVGVVYTTNKYIGGIVSVRVF